jgi:hypothetical protein
VPMAKPFDTAVFSDTAKVPGTAPLIGVASSQLPPVVVDMFSENEVLELFESPTTTLCEGAVPPVEMLKVRVDGAAVIEGIGKTVKLTGIMTAAAPSDLRTEGAAPVVVMAIAPM